MTGSLLNIRNLRIALNGADDQQVVKGLNLSIEPGQTMCLVGESGSGKSLSALSSKKFRACRPPFSYGGRY